MPDVCIAFDLDDTLYLERDYVRSGFDAVGQWAAENLGIQDFRQRAWRAFESDVRGSIFNVVLAETGRTADPQVIADMVRIYRNHCPAISLPADTVQCLQTLRGHAVLAIVTDGITGSQYAKCASLSLASLVNIIICTGEWGPEYYKPNPRAFRHLQNEVGPSISRFVYVADNPLKDFHAPLELGWGAIRIRRAEGLYSRHEWATDPPPYIELSDLWRLPEILTTQCGLHS